MNTSDDSVVSVPFVAVSKEEPPKKHYDVPEARNYSQAMRVAKYLFGPLVRIRTYFPGGKTSHSVYVKNGHETILILCADASDYQDALQTSLDTVRNMTKTTGTLPKGIYTSFSGNNIVATMRSNFALALLQTNNEMKERATEITSKLFPHEIIAIDKLSRKVAAAADLPESQRKDAQGDATSEILRMLTVADRRFSRRNKSTVE